MYRGKRDLLAQGMYWSGATLLLNALPARDTLLVLTYHRIGSLHDDQFGPGVFSATPEQFDTHVSYLKRHLSLITLDEAIAFVHGTLKERTPRCRVLITFDDGYLDNYQIAFPILRSHGAQGVFFLVTTMIGGSAVPWWDHIAFLISTARKPRFSLRYPTDLAVDIGQNGAMKSIWHVSELYRSPATLDRDRFLRELHEAAESDNIAPTQRRFLNWEEAREMIKGGMAIGSHTHSHPVLSQIPPDQQHLELAQSRALLSQTLDVNVDSIAYPYGTPECFSGQTQSITRDAGYRIGFSFYGGTNPLAATTPFDVKRLSVDGDLIRFRVQAAVCRRTGKFWP